jgi:hypothetical protein
MNDTSSTNPMNDATRPRRGLGGGAILVGLCAFLAACDRAEEVESAAETASPPVRQQAAPLPGALYHTELTFVGREEQPSLLHLRFDNRTDSVSIVTRYRGWFGGAEWSEILDHADSLRLRLDSRGSIGSWNSRTGQRESLHLAELQDDSGAESGLLLARQSARRVDEPPDDERGQYFLVSDTAGNGLLIMRDSTSPDAPVTAWTWFDETETEWSDVLILALAPPEDSPGRWSFEFPEAGLLGELRGVPPTLVDASGDGPGLDVFRVYAALVLGGQSWTMSGIGVQERAP